MVNESQIRALDLRDPRDLQQLIAAFEAHSRSLSAENEYLTETVKARLFVALPKTTHLIAFVAEKRGATLGIIFGSYTLYFFTGKHCANVQLLFVLPEYQRQGVGRNLMIRFIEAAQQLDCSKLSLEVRVGNERARALYKTLGFARGTFGPEAEFVEFWEKKLV